VTDITEKEKNGKGVEDELPRCAKKEEKFVKSRLKKGKFAPGIPAASQKKGLSEQRKKGGRGNSSSGNIHSAIINKEGGKGKGSVWKEKGIGKEPLGSKMSARKPW